MKTPVVLVTATLTVAILLAASFLIATGTRGEDTDRVIGQQHAPAVME
jgi:aldose sugar dehydrogenase